MSKQLDDAKQLYAAMASTYDADTRFITGIRQRAIEALALQPGEMVLDAGCGTGWCLPMLSQRVGPRGRVVGFEPSGEMLALAESRIQQCNLANTQLMHASGDTIKLDAPPDAILFSYTHDLLHSRASLEHIFRQCRPGTRIVSVGTKLFPKWFFIGNWYLRYTHRVTITCFDGFERPWEELARFCSRHQVRVTVPGSRYLFDGTLD